MENGENSVQYLAPLTERQKEAAVAIWGSDKGANEALSTYARLIRSEEAQRRIAAWDAAGTDSDPVLHEMRQLLLPALLYAEEMYQHIPRQWAPLFSVALSKMALERIAEMRYAGLAQLTPEGSQTTRDNAGGERFVYSIENLAFALGVAFSREAINDGLCLHQVGAISMGLAESHHQTAEILHANVFNVGEVYQAQIGGDGLPLFSESHPIDKGTYSNVLYDRPLTEAGLEDVAMLIAKFPDQAGLKIEARPINLVVPIALQFQAFRLESALKREHGDKMPPWWPRNGIEVVDYLTDPKAWFVTTSIKGLVSFRRAPFRMDLLIESDKLVIETTERYGMGYYNPRAVIGVLPTGNTDERYTAATEQVAGQMRRMGHFKRHGEAT